jgi:hypothetical protein
MDLLSTLRTRSQLTPAEDSILMTLPERWLSVFFPPRIKPILKDELNTVNNYQRRLARGTRAPVLRSVA